MIIHTLDLERSPDHTNSSRNRACWYIFDRTAHYLSHIHRHLSGKFTLIKKNSTSLIQLMKLTETNAGIHQNVTRGTITLVRSQQVDTSSVGARIRLTLVNV